MKYFSDRENGGQAPVKEEIDRQIWNGIVAIIKEFIANHSLDTSFPERCPDNGQICGCDERALSDGIKSIISDLHIELDRMEEPSENPFEESDNSEQQIDTYAVLDLVEYIYKNLQDVRIVGDYHKFLNHYHYYSDDKGTNKNLFREKINELFERNGLIYTLTNKGTIERTLPEQISICLHNYALTKDTDFNKLVNLALGKIVLPKLEDRKIALEKLWDAFERSKTYFGSDKKKSAAQVLDKLSGGDAVFKSLLDEDCKALTEIGNKFQIRHFEQGKIAINDTNKIDYFFIRMFSYLQLFYKSIDK